MTLHGNRLEISSPHHFSSIKIVYPGFFPALNFPSIFPPTRKKRSNIDKKTASISEKTVLKVFNNELKITYFNILFENNSHPLMNDLKIYRFLRVVYA